MRENVSEKKYEPPEVEVCLAGIEQGFEVSAETNQLPAWNPVDGYWEQ